MRRKFLLLLETGLVLAGLLAGACAWKIDSALEQPLNIAQEELLEVPKGTTPNRTFLRLEADGVIKDAFWLRVYWRFNLARQPLHSGEYRMVPGMTVNGLIDLWKRGEMVQYSLTLVEGWNFHQVRAALAKDEKLEQTLNGLSDSEVMDKLGHSGIFPEGRFFPDTYRFVRGMTDADLLKKAYDRLDEVLLKEWNQRSADVPYTEPYQALIMASLVEKETGVPQERRQIAGVFVRRMEMGMLLQTDPTVIYGLGDRYNGKLTRAHLKEPTPYNTYMIAGLPPTPIAMVGREAIHAALNPADGNSLYFVARGDGSHVFSDDLDAHNNAVREFQINRRADYRSSPAPTVTPSTEDSQAPIPAASPNTAPEEMPPVAPQDSVQDPAQESAPAPEADAPAPQSPQ
ncbi:MULTISPECIES: endolytic transglycosylase MltG [Gammaproteobacteria]|uniref:endolytic transglycosylase MltG n=1 Tax=Gammaproteobacteria TaxID=1236 RepID=UPI001911D235|nr:endolytic transglycosylase MltG [Bacillus sp. TH86]MBK5310570.1 endolytic transglycosylase MltG [Pseudomonas sp. TH71]MBK5316050.1 endolytic transglycosylase MltG [Erwinia sp. TH79]MBK5321553.1 endolytic transglycosylase MltG [Bacillus sp. TH59]MBK5336503.1 endolytic transglycosylase MltG [Bacillus sp. TH57]MBK5369774.1 endolytic transglycosylase MltG [Pseudomonas sp. TH40]MBK5380943.1 endolytic transglycosylase MltG [Pseudomonas sp. TH35]MBK5386402.1 endolytic transglycosylase MltG [Pseu